VEVVASLSQGRTVAAQCGLFTHKSVPVIFEPPCKMNFVRKHTAFTIKYSSVEWNAFNIQGSSTFRLFSLEFSKSLVAWNSGAGI